MAKTTTKTNQYGALGSKENLDKLLEALGAKTTPSPATSTGTFSSGTSQPYGYESDGKFLPYRNEEQATVGGYYGQDAADAMTYQQSGYVEPRMSAQESAGFAKQYGLQGMSDKDFAGLTKTQATIKAKKIQAEKQAQVSQNTSFSFNPQTISGFKKTLNDMKFKLDDTNADPYTPRSQKKDKNAALISSYTDQLAGLFNTPEEFTNAQTQSPDFQKLLKQYEKMGGMATDIQAKIAQPQVSPYASETTQYPSVDQYLTDLSSPEAKMAQDLLLPEKQIAQEQIAFEMSIPEQYKQYYFGTPDQVGFVQRERKLREEEIKLIERKAKLEEDNGRAQANYLIEKNNAEMAKETAEVEENLLAAKNYMTGMLAKLGALKTTGAAPQAMVKIEQKYQKQAQDLRTSYSLANKQIEIKLNEMLDDIEMTRDENILKTKQDLSKSEEQIWKEIAKAQIDADRKTFEIVDRFTADFRRTKESYRKELESAAKKYASSMANTISAYDLQGVMESAYDLQGVMEGDIVLKRGKTGKIAAKGVLSPTGELDTIESLLEASRGSDGYVNSAVYQDMFNKFLKANGTRSEFLNAFPPNEYVNPKDMSLPSFLKFGSSARSEAPKKDDRSDF